MSKEALKLALDALENHSGNYKLSEVECVKHEAVVEAIKEALAQPEQEPVADPFADIHNKRIGEMTEEQQDRAIELWLRNQRGWMPMGQRVHVEALLRVIDGLRATPPQLKEPEQEPVACPECKRLEDELEHANIKATVWKSAYDVEVGYNEQDTAPYVATPRPQRPSRSDIKPLTNAEIRKWWASENGFEDCNMAKLDDFEQVIRAVEGKHGIKEST